MVNISKFGDSAIKFKFTDNDHYLFNGEIEVPINSLLLVLDESDMVTFKKIDGDPFVSFLISNSNFESKETLIYFYKTSMVGSTGGGSESGITSGDVESMIEASLEDYYDIDEIDAALSGKADSSAVTEAINSAVSGKADTSAVTESINAAVSGKADTSSVYTKSEVDTALSGKQDTLIAGDNITINGNVISAEGGGSSYTAGDGIDITNDVISVTGKVDTTAFTAHTADTVIHVTSTEKAAWNAKSDFSGDYNDLTNKPTIPTVPTSNTAFTNDAGYITSDAISGKVDTTTYNSYTAATDTALSGKQDTLVSGTNIKTINNESILGSGNIDIQGGGKAIEAGRGISITTGETADTVSFSLPISAGTGSNSIIVSDSRSKATGNYAFAGGQESSATSFWAFALGATCKARNAAAVSFGYQTQALGAYSFTVGEKTIANKDASSAIGSNTRAKNVNEFSCGVFNNSVSASTAFGNSGNTLFSVGNGTSDSARHNAFEIRQNGDIYITKDGADVKLQDQLGGGSITIDPSLDSGSTNAVANSAITTAINAKENHLTNYIKTWNLKYNYDTDGHSVLYFTYRYNDSEVTGWFPFANINSKSVASGTDFSLIETSAITTSITSSSTDAQVPSAKAVYDALQESGGGGVSESAFTSYSAATDARISEDEEVTAAALNALNDGKQDTLIAGSGITISGNVISAEGGNLVIELTQAEYDALVDKDPNAFYIITDAQEINISDYYTSAQTQSAINAAVSGKQDTLIAGSGITISGNVISANGGGGSITVDTALDSGSTNPVENRVIYDKFDEVEEVTAAALNALNDNFDGLRLKKLTQAEYEALTVKDNNTLYILVG